MAKIKDTIELEKEFANKEIEAEEWKQGYFFDEVNHVHLLNARPLIGTSSMASVLAKGGLTYWAAGLACQKFGWTHPGDAKKGWTPKDVRLQNAGEFLQSTKDFSVEEWVKLGDEAYKAHATKLKTSASVGTDMHAIMEEYVKFCIQGHEGVPQPLVTEDKKLEIFVKWSLSKVKRFIASEVNCYSEKLWLGGICDCVFEDKEGKLAILDFKSSKEVYLSQFWQAVAYAIQLEENGGFTANGIKILSLDKPIDYVCVLPFGMERPEVQYNYDMPGGKVAVEAMLTLYKKLN